MFSMAENLVRRGEADIDQVRWLGWQQGTFGLDGQLYSRKGAGMSLLLVPLVWLGLSVPVWGAATTALLFNSLITAATAWLLFHAVRRLGGDDRIALTAGLIFGLATLAWPYAKTCFSDPLAGLCLTGACLALLRFRDAGRLVDALACGVALALAVATRYANAAFLPLFIGLWVYVLWRRERGTVRRADVIRRRRGWLALGALCAPLAITAALLVLYNVARYGSPFSTGYLPEESFSGDWLQGIAGQLISPGRGLLWYAPVLWLALPVAAVFVRRERAVALLSWGVILGHVFLYGKWFMWHGGYAWGPRFMVPTLPFWVLVMLPAIEWVRRPGIGRRVLVGLAVVSGLVQVAGLSVHFELFQTRLLDTSLPLFDPATFFDPRYSPLIGQLQFVRPANLDFVWIERGAVNRLLLVGLGLGVALSGWHLARLARRPESPRGSWPVAAGVALSVALLGAGLLWQAHLIWPADLRGAVDRLNTEAHSDQAVITGTPEEAAAFADLYRGSARVLGLQVGTLSREAPAMEALQATTRRHREVWWLPNWLPADQSDVERWLMAHGYRAGEHFFRRHAGEPEGRRLVQYYFPPAPLDQVEVTGATFGDLIALPGAAVAMVVEAGGILPVSLYWQALQPVHADYQVFVQLLDERGERLAGADGQPMLGLRPTSGWLPGETVEDRHAVALPTDLPPGRYRLVAGVYVPATGERLAVADGATFVEVAIIQVTARTSRLPTSRQDRPALMKAQTPNAISGTAWDRCISTENAAACSGKSGAGVAPVAAMLSCNASTAMYCIIPIPPGAPGTVSPSTSSGVSRKGANSGTGAPYSKASITG